MITYRKEAIKEATAKKLHLVKIELNGRYAKCGTMSMCGPVGPKMKEKVEKLFVELCDIKKRME